jgi:glycine cleavage system aminomethyltransferase T
MTLDDTPFHVSGMERLVEPQDQDYLGKEVLDRIREKGVDRKLVGMF